MKITDKDVTYVADLANLELDAAEKVSMLRDLNSILGHIGRLNELDTSNVEPMTQVSAISSVSQAARSDAKISETSREISDAGRDDILGGLRQSLSQQAALENAPDADGTFFRVPKVIER